MQTKTFQRDEIIFKEGAFASTMYEVVSGTVGVYAAYGTADERQLASFGPGECFGEMGLVECYPRSATAVALAADTTLVEIDNEDFSSFYRDQPQKVLAIMRQVSARLRDTNEKYLAASQAVYDAIEAEGAGTRRTRSLRGALSGMLKSFRKGSAHA